MALEEPLDLAPRQRRGGRDLIERERLLDVVLHQLRHLDQGVVADADLRAQRHILTVPVVAHAIDDELLGDELRDAGIEFGLDQVSASDRAGRCHRSR